MRSAQQRNGSCLIVEDEPHQARAFARLLSSELEVRVAGSVHEALDVLAASSAVRLVLTDICVPGARQKYGGLDILDAVTARLPDVPRAAITAVGDAGLAALLAQRCTPLIPKPFERAALDTLVDRTLAFPIRSEPLALHVVARARAAGLTPAQRAILCWLVAGRDREAFCESQGMLASTFDWHVDELRKKFDGRPRVDALVASLLREVIEPPKKK